MSTLHHTFTILSKLEFNMEIMTWLKENTRIYHSLLLDLLSHSDLRIQVIYPYS